MPKTYKVLTPLVALGILASGCSSNDEATPKEVIDHYAEGVYVSYDRTVDSAKEMNTAIDAFVANPTDQTLDTAKRRWLEARTDYGRTEAFRFYDGPIDNEEKGKEGLINAWPLDEAYIDYVQGNATAGIINNAAGYPTINADVITEANEKDGETNISTGWHAIEFLLWGQDLSETGPGARPATDFTTAPNADRRKTYLTVATDLLITHLEELVAAWAPNAENYRKEFVALDPNEALRRIITGIGSLSRGELVGERMNVAYEEHSQEDEHSCFSDNTTSDMVANADGIRMVIDGKYTGASNGPGIAQLVETKDSALSKKLTEQVNTSVTDAMKIPAPFDASVRPGVPDDYPGRVAISTTMKSLDTQTDTIVEGAKALGVTINLN